MILTIDIDTEKVKDYDRKLGVGKLKGRIRRIAIVAVARKLLIAPWRYLETGLVPDGAILKI